MSSDDPSGRNRDSWNASSDGYQSRHGQRLAESPTAWGVWRIPESSLQILGDVEGRDVLEFGCGAAQWSIALAGQGARATGLDLSEAQIRHARRLVAEANVDVGLVQANAERAPFADASFDIVFCDHGALTFGRPERTVPEAARLLREGGLLAFCTSGPLRDICWDAENETVASNLRLDYFDLHRIEDDDEIVYQLPYGRWIRLFRRHSLVVEDLVELRPEIGATTTYADYVTLEWARRWPAEVIWKVSRAGESCTS